MPKQPHPFSGLKELIGATLRDPWTAPCSAVGAYALSLYSFSAYNTLGHEFTPTDGAAYGGALALAGLGAVTYYISSSNNNP